MRLAIADTGPLHYLVLIGEIDIIPAQVDAVVIPPEVRQELDRPRTPAPVRIWIAQPSPWLQVQASASASIDPGLARLDPGERAAIALALSVGADAVLTDLQAIGTLGLLQRAARRGLIDLSGALARLIATNFHIRQELLDTLLAEDKAGR